MSGTPIGHRAVRDLAHGGERRARRLGARVEILRDPCLGLAQVLAERGLVAGEQRHARRQQPQLEVFAQEVGLPRRDQGDVPAVHVADAHQSLHLLPEIARGPGDGHFIRRAQAGGDAHRRRRLGDHERQRVDLAHEPVELHRHADGVDLGHRLQALHVVGDRAAQGRGGELVGTSEPLVGRLQGGQRAAHVACQLQLLAREHERLLDFGQHPVVGAAREVPVHLLERHALLLCVGHAGLELR